MALKIDDFKDDAMSRAARLLKPREDKIRATLRAIGRRTAARLESDERVAKFVARAKDRLGDVLPEAVVAGEIDETFLEKQIGPTNDIVSIEFLEYGLLAKRPVGRLRNSDENAFGTGVLVGLDLLLTNNHVLPTPAEASDYVLEMDLENNRLGTPRPVLEYQIDPDRFFLTDQDHDFTLVAVTDFTGMNPPIARFGWHVLLEEQGKILKGQPVNIIQHPRGAPKSLVVHNSYFLHLEDGTDADVFCWYSGDTDSGSSGSPVFNRFWEIVALHHKAIPRTNASGEVLDISGKTMSKERANAEPEKIAYVANQGIRASKLSQSIERAPIGDPDQQEIRDQLIALWKSPGAGKIALRAMQAGIDAG